MTMSFYLSFLINSTFYLGAGKFVVFVIVGISTMLKGNTRRSSEIGSGKSSEISQETPAMKSFQVKLKL